jgi:hypothetical protein
MEALWPYRLPERAAHGSKRKRPYVCKAGIGSPVHGGELPPCLCLLETWRDTPNGVEFREIDGGFLVIYHGKTAKPAPRRYLMLVLPRRFRSRRRKKMADVQRSGVTLNGFI